MLPLVASEFTVELLLELKTVPAGRCPASGSEPVNGETLGAQFQEVVQSNHSGFRCGFYLKELPEL